jgi:hypothetical protein
MGLTDSQVPLAAAAVAVKLKAVAAVVDRDTACAAGVAPPIWKLKVRLLALDESAAPTTNDTSMFSGVLVAPAETTVILPLYVPGARPPPLTSTLRLAGVVPPEGVTESQVPPDVVLALTVKVTAPPELVMATLAGAGAAPPLV